MELALALAPMWRSFWTAGAKWATTVSVWLHTRLIPPPYPAPRLPPFPDIVPRPVRLNS